MGNSTRSALAGASRAVMSAPVTWQTTLRGQNLSVAPSTGMTRCGRHSAAMRAVGMVPAKRRIAQPEVAADDVYVLRRAYS
jgi:hypothetical protein